MIDRSFAAADNEGLSSSPQAFGAAPAVKTTFKIDDLCGKGKTVLIVDFDAAGLDECIGMLRRSREPSVFVVWYPRGLSRAEFIRTRELLLENGATLLSKSDPSESAWTRWEREKVEMEQR